MLRRQSRARGRLVCACTAIVVFSLGGVTMATGIAGARDAVKSQPGKAGSAARARAATQLAGVLDLVKFGLDSLYNSANSYECYQNPKAAKCDLLGLGDIFRNFASPEQKERLLILQQLATINKKLDDLKRVTDETKLVLDQVQLRQLLDALNAGKVLQTLSRLNNISEKCNGKTLEQIQADTTCKTWLGTDSNGHPITEASQMAESSKLGREMYSVANIPPATILKAVQGAGIEEGLFTVLPRVVSDKAALGPTAAHFFTDTDSAIVQSYFEYEVMAELSYMIIYTNYWESVPPAEDVTTLKQTYITAVFGQLGRFKPLPAGTSVDMRTGLMWSTDNHCVETSLQSPAGCSLTQVGGFPLTATCPPTSPMASGCKLATPLIVSDKALMPALLMPVGDTAASSSWKVPSSKQVTDLLNDRGSNGQFFLAEKGSIHTKSEYVWTSAFWCPQVVGYPSQYFTPRGLYCMDAGNKWKEIHHAPLRTVVYLPNAEPKYSYADGCNNGPCSAGYIFVRQPAAAEYAVYGIDKHWS